MQKAQYTVDHTCFFQKRLPCQCAQQEIHPHGKDENQHNKAVSAYVHAGQHHGKGICQQKTDDCAGQRQLYGEQERFGMLCRCHCYNIFQGKSAGFIGYAIIKDHAQRNDDKSGGPEDIWKSECFFIH